MHACLGAQCNNNCSSCVLPVLVRAVGGHEHLGTCRIHPISLQMDDQSGQHRVRTERGQLQYASLTVFIPYSRIFIDWCKAFTLQRQHVQNHNATSCANEISSQSVPLMNEELSHFVASAILLRCLEKGTKCVCVWGGMSKWISFLWNY